MTYSHPCSFFFNDTATTEIYTLSLHDALPIWLPGRDPPAGDPGTEGRERAHGLRELRPLPLLAGIGLTAPPARRASPPDVILYTDGACTGNPGPGGWAAIILDAGKERGVRGAEPDTTNQRIGLTAAVPG